MLKISSFSKNPKSPKSQPKISKIQQKSSKSQPRKSPFSDLKSKRKDIQNLISFTKRINVQYEINGEIDVSKSVKFITKQKGIKNGNRFMIKEPTRCSINFHTHPGFLIWPSIEDIYNVLHKKNNVNISVIVTRFGLWLMTNSNKNKIEIKNIEEKYKDFNIKMGGFYNYVYTYLSNKLNSLNELDDGVMTFIYDFIKSVKHPHFYIGFFRIDSKVNQSNTFKNELKKLQTKISCNI